MLAEANDQATGTRHHTAALQESLTALEEMDDFISGKSDLGIFIAGHETRVLANADPAFLTPTFARLEYLRYAESRLGVAVNQLAIASDALRSLGKIHEIANRFEADISSLANAKSMVMLRVATSVNTQDAVSARELGVHYARLNRLQEAKSLLVKSLLITPDATAWSNLAAVHQALGEDQLAWQAWNEAQLANQWNYRTPLVHWTNPQQFTQVQSMVDPPVMTAQRQTPRPGTVTPAAQNFRR